MRRQYVAVCPSADQIRCDRSLKWHHGWLVFVDADNNGERDTDADIVGEAVTLAWQRVSTLPASKARKAKRVTKATKAQRFGR